MTWRYKNRLESPTASGLFLHILREIRLEWDDITAEDVGLQSKPLGIDVEGKIRLLGETLGDFVLTYRYDWRKTTEIVVDTAHLVEGIAYELGQIDAIEEEYGGDVTFSSGEADDWPAAINKGSIKTQVDALDYAPFVPSSEEIVEHFGVDAYDPFVVGRLFGAPCLAWVDEDGEPQAVMHPKDADVDKAVRALSKACVEDVRKDVMDALKKLK